jgi:hypothetical protein
MLLDCLVVLCGAYSFWLAWHVKFLSVALFRVSVAEYQYLVYVCKYVCTYVIYCQRRTVSAICTQMLAACCKLSAYTRFAGPFAV